MLTPSSDSSQVSGRWAESLLELKDVNYWTLQEAINNWTIKSWIWALIHSDKEQWKFEFVNIKEYIDAEIKKHLSNNN